MKIILLTLIFLTSTLSVSAATTHTYQTGKKGGCYYIDQSKKTKKMNKVYVDRKYCTKKK